MSVILATRFSDRIEMAADGGQWTPDGVLRGKIDKLLVSPTAPFAVGGVGGGESLWSVARFCIGATMGATVDQAIEYLERVLPDRPEVTDPAGWEVVIGAVSETSGPGIWRFRSLRLDDTESPRLRFSFSNHIALGPALDVDELRACGWRSDDFSAGLVNQFEAMRAKQVTPEWAPGWHAQPASYVGCHVDHAVVTADGVSVRRVREWPDVVGGPIGA